MVKQIDQYKWSSYRATDGLEEKPDFLIKIGGTSRHVRVNSALTKIPGIMSEELGMAQPRECF
ncbi:MAG: hypothetical protein ACMUJM_19500 [bacterium]